jgi:ubiquinone biosynthesis protein
VGAATPSTAADEWRTGRRWESLWLLFSAAARVAWLGVLLPQLAVRRRRRPAVLRRYLRACGGGFAELGRMLAMRYDRLPLEYCVELLELSGRAPAAPLSRMERVIAEDLRRPVANCFRSVAAAPLRATSIAQVHAARLPTGEAVAVKVARPGIERTVAVDLWCLRLAAGFTRRFGIYRRLELDAVVRELSPHVREELDLRRQARHAALLHERLREDDVDHRAPEVHFSVSGPRVVTVELIEGATVEDLLAAVQGGDRGRLEEWSSRGIRPRRTARLLQRSILEQALRHPVFNAHPHPADLVVEGGGTLAWVDFGMVGWLDQRTRAQQLRMQRALATGRIQRAVEALLEGLAPLPARDLSGFELQARAIFGDWIRSSADSHATPIERSTARCYVRLLGAIRAAGITVPADLACLFRTLILGDLVRLRLDPAMDSVPELRALAGDETGRWVRRALSPAAGLGAVLAAGQAWLRFFTASSDLVSWLDVRMPELTRTYERDLSRLGRVGVLLLRYTRLGIAAFVVVVVLAHVPQTRVGALASLDERAGHLWLALALGGVATIVVLSRILGELERR